MIQPVLKNDALLEDIRNAGADPSCFHVWWLGQSGFLIRWQDRFLLFDPYLSDSLTRKYDGTDKPHVRMTELAVDPQKLNFLDIVTSSHNHTDHLDAETLQALLRVNPELKLVVPAANRAFAAERLKVKEERLTSLDAGESGEFEGFRMHAVPAAHNTLDRDDQGRFKYVGYIAEFGPFTVYHSGDTLWYEGMEDRLKAWKIDVAFLPINGNKPERRVAGNLDGREAATLANRISARWVVPCHYEMFEFNTESPELFESTAVELKQPFKTLRCGERWTVSQ